MREWRDKLFPVRGSNNIITVEGNIVRLKKSIIGNDNNIQIKDSVIKDSLIWIRGNGNRLIINEGCIIGKGCSFWFEGNNNTIIIGKKTTMTQYCHFNASEHDTKIVIDEDCMFSNTIVVRTSDSHPIYNNDNERINLASDIHIGKHVWTAPNSVIMKGAEIGDGCIVGSYSMVNKTIPQNCLVVGMPAKIVKENIHWTREDIVK